MHCLRVLAAVVVGGGLALGAGCGLRSNALGEFDDVGNVGDGGDAGSDPDREGSCVNPILLPQDQSRFVISGELAGGGGTEDGPCGRDDGPEDVYVYSAAADVDVSLRATTVSDFVPTVRVERDTCGDPSTPAEICSADLIVYDESNDRFSSGLSRHFLAEAGSDYFITIDSPAGTVGAYEVEVTLGWPPLEQCGVHSETIFHAPGGAFSWVNDFGAGYGRVSSNCFAPGKENMFRLVADQPGFMFVEARASGGFEPVLSFRTACAGLSELQCTSPHGASASAMEVYIEAPGEYFLVVDNAGTEAGSYELFVFFE